MAEISSLLLPLSRQHYTSAQKVGIVEQSMAPGVSIASVAMANGINANQLHRWRYQYKKGELGSKRRQSTEGSLELLPVSVATVGQLHKRAVSSVKPTPLRQTSIQGGHVELEVDGYRLRVHGHVHTDALRAILQALR